jgi:hypothetical protein
MDSYIIPVIVLMYRERPTAPFALFRSGQNLHCSLS